MRLLPALVLTGLAVVTAGCGGTSSSPAGTTTAVSTSTATATGTPGGTDGGSAQPAATASAEGTDPSGVPSLAAAPDTPGTSLRPTTVASAASGQPVAPPTVAAKKFGSAKLPRSVGGYTGVISAQGSGQAGQYTGSNPDDLLTAMLNPISATGAITRLQQPQKVGDAVCGAATDGSGMTCVVALDGGQLVVQGSDTSTAASLGRTTNEILATFA